MNKQDAHVASQVFNYSLAGSFLGMVTVSALLWFDVSSIGSMFETADDGLLANVFLSGAMLKGAVLGAAVGTAMLRLKPKPALSRASHRQTTGLANRPS